jgi:hypothetical protein
VPSSLGRQLLRRLRRHQWGLGTLPDPRSDQLPHPVSAERLRQAAQAAASGRATGREELALLLLAADRVGEAGLLEQAEQVLRRAEPRLWLSLDAVTRRSWWHVPGWWAAAVERLATGEPGLVGLVVASFHPDGYVREAAVARLGELEEPLAAAPLALRAGDWVPQVRDRARLALEHRLAEPQGATLVAVAPVALALQQRREGCWLAERIHSMLRHGPPSVLGAALGAHDWRTRRAAYAAALAMGRLDLSQLVAAAEHDSDLPTRVRCAQAAVAAAVAAGTVDAVRGLLASGTAAVRAEAVHALARAGDVTPAVAALGDRNRMVRAVAQAAVRRASADPAEWYRQRCSDAPPNPGVIAGLGETGGSQDVGLVMAWLAHPLPRGRAEAVRALRRLGVASPEVVGELLGDPAASVTRQATIALRPWAARLDPQRLRGLLAAAKPRHVRLAAYRLLRERDLWTRLLVDLDLVADASPALRNRARDDLGTWLTREAATAYSRPPAAMAAALDDRLRRAEATLGRDRVRLLRFHLGLPPRSFT